MNESNPRRTTVSPQKNHVPFSKEAFQNENKLHPWNRTWIPNKATFGIFLCYIDLFWWVVFQQPSSSNGATCVGRVVRVWQGKPPEETGTAQDATRRRPGFQDEKTTNVSPKEDSEYPPGNDHIPHQLEKENQRIEHHLQSCVLMGNPQRGGHFSVASRELYLSCKFLLGRIRVDPSQKHLRIPVHVRCRIMKYFHTYG